jgi:NADH dehydrogenase
MRESLTPPVTPLRVFLTGATGFIGGHVLRLLVARGHAVTCLARGDGAGRIRPMGLPGVRVVQEEFSRPEAWLHEVGDHDVVVNCVGIIRERPGARFRAIHTEAPIALFEAAARVGVRKIVQVSALGAATDTPGAYYQTKFAADRRLMELKVPYVILRPSIVYGPGDHSMSYFLALAALPITPVPGDGRALLQPVFVEDVALAVALAVERAELAEIAVDLGGADTLSFNELLDRLARRLGKGQGARKLHMPWALVSLMASLTDALGGRGPITRDELSMLARGSHGDNRPFVERFGFAPLSLEAGLARTPLDPADAWHAWLRFLRVSLRLLIGATLVVMALEE